MVQVNGSIMLNYMKLKPNQFLTLLATIFLIFNILSIPASAQLLRDNTELDTLTQDYTEAAGLGRNIDLAEVVSMIIRVLLSFLGVIFVILIIYAGFLWLTSAGNEDKISKAKKTMTAAVIGLAIVLAAYTITYFVIDKLLEATKGGVGLD